MPRETKNGKVLGAGVKGSGHLGSQVRCRPGRDNVARIVLCSACRPQTEGNEAGAGDSQVLPIIRSCLPFVG